MNKKFGSSPEKRKYVLPTKPLFGLYNVVDVKKIVVTFYESQNIYLSDDDLEKRLKQIDQIIFNVFQEKALIGERDNLDNMSSNTKANESDKNEIKNFNVLLKKVDELNAELKKHISKNTKFRSYIKANPVQDLDCKFYKEFSGQVKIPCLDTIQKCLKNAHDLSTVYTEDRKNSTTPRKVLIELLLEIYYEDFNKYPDVPKNEYSRRNITFEKYPFLFFIKDLMVELKIEKNVPAETWLASTIYEVIKVMKK